MQQLRNVSPEEREVRVVAAEAEHHEVRVQPVQAVPRVRVIAGQRLLVADEVHDLVLTLARGLVSAVMCYLLLISTT